MMPEDASMVAVYKPRQKTPPRQNAITAEAAGEFGIIPRCTFVSGMVSRGLREDFICLILISKSEQSVGVFSMVWKDNSCKRCRTYNTLLYGQSRIYI